MIAYDLEKADVPLLVRVPQFGNSISKFKGKKSPLHDNLEKKFLRKYPNNPDRRDGVVVRASASQLVDLGFNSLVD